MVLGGARTRPGISGGARHRRLSTSIAVVACAAMLAVLLVPAEANGPAWPPAGQVVFRLGVPGVDSVVHPDPAPNLVSLTFDDGPHPTRTPAILDILRARGVKATFFVLGDRARAYPSLVQRMAAEGHVVASHTVNHSDLTRLSLAQQRAQVHGGADIVDSIIGPGAARCVRPPYGAYDSTTVQVSRERGLAVVLWSRDINDWRGWSTSQMVSAALSTARDSGRGIVVMHDVHANTVQALPSIISALSDRGYRFTTICGDGRGGVPSEGDRRFVQATFRTFLGRSTTPDEMDQWGSHLAYGGSRDVLTHATSRSHEWTTRTIHEMYVATFGRAADGAGLAFWRDQFLHGMPMTDIGTLLAASAEFFALSGSTADGYVESLYRVVLHRLPDTAGMHDWVVQLERGTSRFVVARSFYDSVESRRGRVDRTYHAVLGRGADPSGLLHWSDQLLRYDDVRLAANLARSQEFFIRAQIIGA